MKNNIIYSVLLTLALTCPVLLLPGDVYAGAPAPDKKEGAAATGVHGLLSSAKAGDVQAQLRLGKMYFKGRDYKKALIWYKKAALQGNREAQYNLARIYTTGLATPRDYVLGYMWFNIAGAGGLEKAAASLDPLEAKMTPGQIARAQRMSREFRKK